MKVRRISLRDPSGLPLSRDKEVLLERVARIIMTSPYERVNNPMFGSLIFNSFLFELPNILMQNVELHLRNVIENYEPRLLVRNVDITTERDIATIKIDLIERETFEDLTFETSILI